MAALSVQSARLGTKAWSPSATHASRIRSRSRELAATPPPMHRPACTGLGGGPTGLGDQHVHHRLLERCRDVFDDRIGVAAGVVHDRRLQATETEPVAVIEHGPREVDGRLTVDGHAVDGRAARISQTEVPGHLVERLAGCVVDGPTEHLVLAVVTHEHEHRVTARHQQHDQRQLEPGLFEEGRIQMGLEMVDGHERHVPHQARATSQPTARPATIRPARVRAWRPPRRGHGRRCRLRPVPAPPPASAVRRAPDWRPRVRHRRSGHAGRPGC